MRLGFIVPWKQKADWCPLRSQECTSHFSVGIFGFVNYDSFGGLISQSIRNGVVWIANTHPSK